MKIVDDVQKGLLSFFNYPYVSKELLNNIKGPVIMHISDTPVDIYNYIFRLIDIIKPKFIIHTGDMVDNIKLEIHKNRVNCYEKGVAKLIEGLEKNEFSKVYYTLGNHDDYSIVNKLTKKGIIIKEGHLKLDNCNLTVSHFFREYFNNTDLYLYGHSHEPGHVTQNGMIVLNGLLNINIIDMSNKNIFHVEYPIGTNSSRGMGFKRIKL